MAARVDRYWARFFGLDVALLARPGVHVTPHVGLRGWHGVWFFRRAASCIVSAPPDRTQDLAELLAECSPAELGRRERAAELLPEATAIIGPAFDASLSPVCFRPRPDPDVRPLGPDDARAVDRLRAACAPSDWAAGGPPDDGAVAFGRFQEGDLVSVAHLRRLGDDACDPGVITHPDRRGRGDGTAVVSAAAARAIADDLLVLYQTLAANEPAVALARRLGFDPYGTHLALRLPSGG